MLNKIIDFLWKLWLKIIIKIARELDHPDLWPGVYDMLRSDFPAIFEKE